MLSVGPLTAPSGIRVQGYLGYDNIISYARGAEWCMGPIYMHA